MENTESLEDRMSGMIGAETVLWSAKRVKNDVAVSGKDV